MFKLFSTAVISMVLGTAYAAGYGAAGCGLGSMLLGSEKGFVQVFASTTNGTAGSQTFGISSGTSNCGSGGKTAVAFIDANKTSLSSDIAKGQGETLDALAEIYGVKDVHAMRRTLKPAWKDIFNSADASMINKNIHNKLAKSNLL